MATKKAASSTKKSSSKKSTSSAKATTKVTTIKAVDARDPKPATQAASVSKRSVRFSLSRTPLIAALVAEFVGTFVFAATIIAGQGQPILVFFALVGIVLAFGALSGAYVNPALTLGAWVTRRLSGRRAIGYMVAQFLGAMLALVVLNAYVHAAPVPAQGDISTAAAQLFKAAALPHGKEWFIFFSELIGTTIFGFAVAAATREKREKTAAAFTAGIGVFLGLMVAGSAAAYLGGSSILNPAVAVSLQAIDFSTVWPIGVYVIGSALGAVIGFVLYDLLRGAETEQA